MTNLLAILALLVLFYLVAYCGVQLFQRLYKLALHVDSGPLARYLAAPQQVSEHGGKEIVSDKGANKVFLSLALAFQQAPYREARPLLLAQSVIFLCHVVDNKLDNVGLARAALLYVVKYGKGLWRYALLVALLVELDVLVQRGP